MASATGSWGGRNAGNNRGRLRIVTSQSPSSVGSGTSSVTLTIDVYLQTEYTTVWNGFSVSISGALSWTGSANVSHGSSGGETRIARRTLTVSTQYAQSVSRSFTASISGLTLFPTPPSVSVTHVVPARPISAPSAPSNVTATRQSDSRINVSWTRTSAIARPYESQRVQRHVWGLDQEWGSWVTIATLGATATSYADSGVRDNRSYQYRVQARNSAGSGTSGASGSVRTTPIAPSGVSASKLSDGDIRVSFTQVAPFTSDVEHVVQDNPGGTGWVTVGTLPGSGRGGHSFTHVDPDPGVTHEYRVATRETRTNLISGYSDVSNVVQLLAPPSAPTRVAPSGVLDRDGSILFEWSHNPVDSSDQTAYELRYRVNAAAWVTLTGTTASTRTLTALGVSGTIEWQVRTRGAHVDWSDWSSIGSFTLAATPSVAINSPDGSDLHESRVTVLIGYAQADGSPQARVQAELVYDGTVVETLSWSGTADTDTFKYALDDDEEYTVNVRVQAGNGLWSDYDSVTFLTDFPSPVPFQVEAEWDRETGAVTVAAAPTREPALYEWTGAPNASTSTRTTDTGAVTNLFTNPDMVATGGTVEVWRNHVQTPTVEHGLGAFLGVRSTLSRLVTSRPEKIGEYLLGIDLAGPSDPGTSYVYQDIDVPSGDPEWVAISILVGRSTGGANLAMLRIRSRANGAWDNGVQGDFENLPSDQLVTMALAHQVPPEADTIRVYLYFRTDMALSQPEEGRALTDGWMVAFAGTEDIALAKVETFHDGDHSPDPDLTPRWLGTPGESESVLEGQRVAGLTATGGVVVQSSRWSKSDGPSARLINTSDSRMYVTVSGMSNALSGAVWYRLEDQITDVYSGARSIYRYSPTGSSEQAPNREGDTLLRVNWDDSYSTNNIRVEGPGGIGESVWIDLLTVTDAMDYEGPPFSGASHSTVEAETVTYQRRDSTDSPWVTIAEHVDPGTSITDPVPALGAPEYRAISHTSLPSSTTGPVLVVPWVHGHADPIFVNSGDGFEMVAKAIGKRASDTPGIEQGGFVAAGFDYPLAVFGEGSSHVTSFDGTILQHFVDQGLASTREEWIALLRQRQVVCYRDCQGRKLFGLLSVSFGQDGPVETISLTVEQVWHEEGATL